MGKLVRRGKEERKETMKKKKETKHVKGIVSYTGLKLDHRDTEIISIFFLHTGDQAAWRLNAILRAVLLSTDSIILAKDFLMFWDKTH